MRSVGLWSTPPAMKVRRMSNSAPAIRYRDTNARPGPA